MLTVRCTPLGSERNRFEFEVRLDRKRLFNLTLFLTFKKWVAIPYCVGCAAGTASVTKKKNAISCGSCGFQATFYSEDSAGVLVGTSYGSNQAWSEFPAFAKAWLAPCLEVTLPPLYRTVLLSELLDRFDKLVEYLVLFEEGKTAAMEVQYKKGLASTYSEMESFEDKYWKSFLDEISEVCSSIFESQPLYKGQFKKGVLL